VPWVGRLQRFGYSLAIWAALNALIAITFFRPAKPGGELSAPLWGIPSGVLLLILGWAIQILAYAVLSPMLPARRCAKPRAAPEGEEGMGRGGGWSMRSVSGVAKRWWEIDTIAAPAKELKAPRVRVAASRTARKEIETARFLATPLGRIWRLTQRLLAICCWGTEASQNTSSPTAASSSAATTAGGTSVSAAAARYMELEAEPGPDELNEVCRSRPRWDAALELNLSYQHLGSKYQQPELLKVHSLKSALGSAFIG
jgi:hypothetical protein